MRTTRHHPVRLDLLLILSGLMLGIAAPAAAHHCKGGHASDAGCGGGGSGSTDTSPIPLDCTIMGAAGDSFRSDGLGEYRDDVDKVMCTTGSSGENVGPSHIRLYTIARGNVSNAIRKVDFVIDEGTCTNAAGCAIVPAGVFAEADSIDEMEDGRFWLRAHDGEAGLNPPHIQELPPDATYSVSMGFDLPGMARRWVFELNSQEANCQLAGPAVTSDDATLYVWPDGDSDGKPDGWTVTTAAVLDTSSLPPVVTTPGARTASLCSNVGIDGSGCGGPGGSDICHLISQMEVQFTLHAVNQ